MTNTHQIDCDCNTCVDREIAEALSTTMYCHCPPERRAEEPPINGGRNCGYCSWTIRKEVGNG